MTRHFKSKKIVRRLTIVKYIFIIIFTYFLIHFCIFILLCISPAKYISTDLLISDSFEQMRDITINNPVNLLNLKPNYHFDSIASVSSSSDKNNRIYIYSTHQTEKYKDNKTVVKASEYFQKKLEIIGIEVQVENGNIQEFLLANNYSYNFSYVASRYFLEEEISKNNYDLIIDLHRDAVSKSSSTTTIKGKKCAKILFVIGKKHKNYKENYDVAKKLNNLIKKQYPTLTRGILLQSGDTVNGIYNQDLASNIILIELGGNNNYYEEVQNTIDLLVPIIGEYLNEKQI